MTQTRREFLEKSVFIIPVFYQKQVRIQIEHEEGWLLDKEGETRYLETLIPGADLTKYPPTEINILGDLRSDIYFDIPSGTLHEVLDFLNRNNHFPKSKHISSLEFLASSLSANPNFLELNFGLKNNEKPKNKDKLWEPKLANLEYGIDNLILNGQTYNINLTIQGRRKGSRKIQPLRFTSLEISDSYPVQDKVETFTLNNSREVIRINTFQKPGDFVAYLITHPRNSPDREVIKTRIGDLELKLTTYRPFGIEQLEPYILGRYEFWAIAQTPTKIKNNETTVPNLRKNLESALKKQKPLEFNSYWKPKLPGFLYSRSSLSSR
jgi:hypothetical protein